MMNKFNNIRGFTLVELIIVIAISGIIAAAIAVFMRSPIISYKQTMERAELADEAYLIIRKLKQEIRMSLPNSVRIATNGDKVFVEFLSISNGGKYRSQKTLTNTGDILDFTSMDSSFDVLSEAMVFRGGEKIVVANIGGVGYDAYSEDNMATYSGPTNMATSNIQFASKLFPLESVNETFFVVDKVISYVCDKTNGTLTKYWGYPISSSQPINILTPPLLTSSSTLVSKNIKDCSFVYEQGTNSRNGIVTLLLKLKNEAQEVTLYADTYVKNI